MEDMGNYGYTLFRTIPLLHQCNGGFEASKAAQALMIDL